MQLEAAVPTAENSV